MRVWTDLCYRKWSHAAGNNLDGSVRQEMLLHDWKQFYASLDRSVRHGMLLSNWERFYASVFASLQQEILLCCWKQFYASMRQATVLSSWNQIYATNCWQNSILNFSSQSLNRNVQSPSVSTVMTHHSAQPKPVWKKAPPGLQRPSRIANPSGWPSITPRYLTHTLDPTLKASGARVFVTIRLLKKDFRSPASLDCEHILPMSKVCLTSLGA